MKIKTLLFLFVAMVTSWSIYAQSAEGKPKKASKDKTETFTVYGNCNMCKRTIEGSLKDVKGVSMAKWDKDELIMTVSYNPKKISLDKIKQRIADVGYDSDTHRAKDEVYNNLHGCCQYVRPE